MGLFSGDAHVCTSLQIVGEWSDVRTGVPDGMSISMITQLCKAECCTKKNNDFRQYA